MSETMLTCASHSPLMYCRTTKPPQEEEVNAAFASRAEAVRSFAPEVIFSFGPDHYTSMFQRLAPAFVMGTKAEAVGDIGGHPGTLDVPYQLAFDCIDAVYKAGVDVAVSHDLKIDHGSSQALHRVAGGISAFPTIPILINIFTQPLPPFRRSRLLGEAIGIADCELCFSAPEGCHIIPSQSSRLLERGGIWSMTICDRDRDFKAIGKKAGSSARMTFILWRRV
jgi:2,3-dihydroxyphenylpropionate 1,2-dioxygenase